MNIGHEKLEVTSWMCTRTLETQKRTTQLQAWVYSYCTGENFVADKKPRRTTKI